MRILIVVNISGDILIMLTTYCANLELVCSNVRASNRKIKINSSFQNPFKFISGKHYGIWKSLPTKILTERCFKTNLSQILVFDDFLFFLQAMFRMKVVVLVATQLSLLFFHFHFRQFSRRIELVERTVFRNFSILQIFNNRDGIVQKTKKIKLQIDNQNRSKDVRSSFQIETGNNKCCFSLY